MKTLNTPSSDFSMLEAGRGIAAQQTLLNAPTQKPSLNYEKAGLQIDRGEKPIHNTPIGHHANVSYAFFDDNFRPTHGETYRPFNAEQKAMVVQAMNNWADVADLTFTPAQDNAKADIKFGLHPNAGGTLFSGATGWPDGTPEIWCTISDSGVGPHSGSYVDTAYEHEIGHALGLQHPSNYNGGSPTYEKDASYQQDSFGYTVMSYFSETNTGQDFKGYCPAGPLLDDISAIQHFYGANTHAHLGDTTYGFNSNCGRDDMSLRTANDKAVFAVWDAGGHNTFDFSGYTQDQKIDLHQLAFSDVGGMKGNVAIAKGTHINEAIGGQGNDILIGNNEHDIINGTAGNNLIYGGRGGDTLTGGKGHNTFYYAGISDSTVDDPDHITDFKSGQDKIDLSGLFGYHLPTTKYADKDHAVVKSMAIGLSGVGDHQTNVFVAVDGHDMSHPDMKIKVSGDVTFSDFVCDHDHQVHSVAA